MRVVEEATRVLLWIAVLVGLAAAAEPFYGNGNDAAATP